MHSMKRTLFCAVGERGGGGIDGEGEGERVLVLCACVRVRCVRGECVLCVRVCVMQLHVCMHVRTYTSIDGPRDDLHGVLDELLISMIDLTDRVMTCTACLMSFSSA